MTDNLVFAPASRKQELFLNSDCTITLAGGAAGSGKTYTSLLIALKFMQHPRATGVIFRRTSKMITAPGSIWHEAVNMFNSIYPKGLKIRARDTEIVFPNGALLKFSHMQHASDMYAHKGGQYSLVIFDEATDFEEDMVIYLLSRMRNAYVDYTPQMFLMTNPDFNSFLRTYIQDYYLDSNGIPIDDRAGHKRYFVRQGNNMLWASDRKELESIYGAGPESGISSFTFIGARCTDNPPLLKAQPDYVSRLLSLPEVEVKRLYWGSWFARQEAAGHFKREWISIVSHPNYSAKKRVRSWDLAMSLPNSSYPDPDWTRGILFSKDNDSFYTVEDVASLRDRVSKVEELIFMTAVKDGRDVTISLPLDPGASAQAYVKTLQRRLGELGFSCKLCRTTKSKLARFAPFSSIAQSGFVRVVEADWNKPFFEELEVFDGERSRNHDDQVDCCGDAMSVLNTQMSIPDFSLPDLSTSPAFTMSQGLSIPVSGLTLPNHY